MKRKFLLILLAIISAFCLAFGIAACDAASSDNSDNSDNSGNSGSSGGDSSGGGSATSDQVTSSQWASALGVLNFTCTYNSTYTGTSTNGSVTSTATETSQGTYKVAFTADSNGYISGNAYMSNTYSGTESDSTGESENYTSSSEYYEIVTATSYKQAYREADSSNTSSAEWHSASETISGYEMDDTYVGMLSPVYGLGLEDLYSQFTYSNGAYTATISLYDTPYNITVVISNGYVSSITFEVSYSDSEETMTGTATYTFTNCGSTTVSVPSEVSALFEETSGGDSTGGGNTPSPEVPDEDHDLTKVEAVAATCTTAGNIEYWYCEDCGKYFADAEATEEITQAQTVIPARHTLTHYAKIDATCAVAGNIEYWYCSVCGKYFSDEDCETEVTQSQTVIEATGEHNYENGFCTVCGAEQPLPVLDYTLSSDKSYYIVSGIGGITGTAVEIPATYNDITVKEIASSAFEDNTKITSVTIADSVTSIGSSAFSGCTALESVTIGSGVISIGSYAFNGCNALEKVNSETAGEFILPDSITSIGSFAFFGCLKATSITIPEAVTTISSGAFGGCLALTTINYNAETVSDSTADNLIFFYAGSAGTGITVNIGAKVTKIPAYLFDGYYSDIINGSSTQTTEYAPKITSVVFASEGVCTTIGTYAFAYCSALTNVTIGSSITTIGTNAFYNTGALTEINFNATAVDDLSASVFTNAGSDTDGVTVNIGANVTKIPAYIFYQVTKITSVVFAENSECTTIGANAFYGCTALTTITIPEKITTIGENAFYNCKTLTVIYYNAIEYEDKYPTVSWNSHNAVFTGAGQNSEGMTVNVGAKVTKIPDYLFYQSYVKSVVFADNSECTSIGGYSFADITTLTAIVIPDSVTTISEGAFSGCSGLVSITLPFVGGSAEETTASKTTLFGYIFGTSNYSGGTATEQRYNTSSAYQVTYYIPSTLTTVKITGGNILFGAFYGCTTLTSITMPEDITSIANYAFNGCTLLTSIIIPANVTSIGNYSFYECTGLVEVCNLSTLKITADATGNGYVAYYAINVCTEESKMGTFITQDDFTFYGFNGDYYLVVYSGTDTEITLPALTVESKNTNYVINKNLFYNNTSITSVTIPDSVTAIGGSAFYKCTALTSINIGSGVTTIGDSAFHTCQKLESVTLPASLKTIGSYAFANSSLTSITIPSGVTSIGSNAFYNCSSIASITIGSGVTSIGREAFRNTAFYNDSGNWTDNVLYIGTYLIAANTSIENSYEIKSETTLIAEDAFYNCTKLTGVTIPNSVTAISDYTFRGCTSLESVTIPDSITYIGASAFYGCKGLKSIAIPDAITIINDSVFNGCSSLTSITIPSGVTSIGSYAFSGCTGLTSITIPGNVTSIGSYAFNGCTGLTSITIPEGVTSIGAGAFYGCTGLTSITIPESVTSIDTFAFYNCTNLTSVTIPASVTYIGSYAFSGCTALASVTFEDTTGWWCSTSPIATEGTDLTLTSTSDNVTYLTSTYYTYYWFKTVTTGDTADYVGNTYQVDFTTLTYYVNDVESTDLKESSADQYAASMTMTITFADSETATFVMDAGENAKYSLTGNYTLNNGTFTFTNCAWDDGSTTEDTSGEAATFGDATEFINGTMVSFGYDGTNVTFLMNIGGSSIEDEEGNVVSTEVYTVAGTISVVTE